MRLFNRYFSSYELLLLFGDAALTVFATTTARIFIVVTNAGYPFNWSKWLALAVLIATIVVVAFYYADLYDLDQTVSSRELILRFVNGFGVTCVIVGTVSYPIHEEGSQNIYLVQVLILGIGLFAWRLVFTEMLKRRKVHGRVAIVGTETIGKIVAEAICKQKHLGVEVVGFIGTKEDQITLTYGNPKRICLPVFPQQSTLDVVESQRVNRILIAGEAGDLLGQDLLTLRFKGIPIEDCHTFYERLMSKIAIVDLRPEWFVLSKGFRRTRWILFAKRVTDVVAATFGLIFAAPLALLAAVAIKLDSPGAILFCQERVGQNDENFILYKFRSMFENAEARTGPVWAEGDDPRITRVGRFLRKLRFDEIPQLFNVLKGEMSFVGPRPERPFFVATLKKEIPYYYLRFSIKPGVTGWAQISYRYGSTHEDAVEKLQYDLYYIKNVSPAFDLQILFETIKVVLLSRGAR